MKAERPILGDNGQGHNFYTLENCENSNSKKEGSFKGTCPLVTLGEPGEKFLPQPYSGPTCTGENADFPVRIRFVLFPYWNKICAFYSIPTGVYI